MYKKRVCVDFDKTINSYASGWTGEFLPDGPISGAREALRRLCQDYEVVIFSCRTHNNDGIVDSVQVNLMKDWLDAHEIPYHDIYVGNRKPVCELFIDDRGLRFEGDWDSTLADALKILSKEEEEKDHIKVLQTWQIAETIMRLEEEPEICGVTLFLGSGLQKYASYLDLYGVGHVTHLHGGWTKDTSRIVMENLAQQAIDSRTIITVLKEVSPRVNANSSYDLSSWYASWVFSLHNNVWEIFKDRGNRFHCLPAYKMLKAPQS